MPIFIQQVGVRKSVPDAGAIVDEGLTKLNSLNLGWTWWTYREANSPDGLGYAPYSKGTDWKLDQAWLNHITSHF